MKEVARLYALLSSYPGRRLGRPNRGTQKRELLRWSYELNVHCHIQRSRPLQQSGHIEGAFCNEVDSNGGLGIPLLLNRVSAERTLLHRCEQQIESIFLTAHPDMMHARRAVT